MKQKKLKKVDGGKRRGALNIKKTRGKKAQDFLGKNVDKETAERAIDSEDCRVWQKTIFFSALAILGIALILLGIQDNMMTFEGLGIKLTCSLVGVLIVIGAIIGMMRNNPKITINNDK